MNSSNFLHKHYTSKLLAVCIVFSFMGHAFATVLLERFSTYSFGKPLSEPASIIIELSQTPPVATSRSHAQQTVRITHKNRLWAQTAQTERKQEANPPSLTNSDAMTTPPILRQAASPAIPSTLLDPAQTVVTKQLPPDDVYVHADQIVPAAEEKLVYQISLAGVPVGSAQLDASNNNGELRIQSTIRSNSVVSSIYTVNDSIDTRLIKSRFLLTRIKQHEGLFKSDTGFTIMYPDRKIFWVDRLKKRYSNEPLESLDTLDFVSGFYFLRQKALKIGDRFSLNLYDGDTTTKVPITVLRWEKLSLPGMRSADTLVVQPTFAESGFFKNNHDLLVWFTNDENRVPVRFEATTPIGRVTAELVSSERVAPSDRLQTTSNIVPANKIQYK